MAFIVPHRLPATPHATSSVLALLRRVIPPDVVEAVIAQYTTHVCRRRKLPGELVVLLLIAWQLLPAAALDLVLTTLLAGFRSQQPEDAGIPASASGISHARYRWGSAPLRILFRRVCVPLATPATVGAWFGGWHTVALDGSMDDLADTPANAQCFGRHGNQFGRSAFPQLLGMYLVECGTHAMIDAGFWPCHASQPHAARRLLRSITAAMLVCYDQGLHGYPLISGIVERHAQFLGRVPPGQTFTVVDHLADGTALCRFWAKTPYERTKDTPSILVRVITYTLTDPARVGYNQPHRLMTSLLDPATYSALDVICAYHERWEIEGTIDELKTHQRLSAHPLRSLKPVGVIQEAYGLLLAHYAVRAVMHDAALQAGIDPDRISFVHAIRLIGLMLPSFQGAPPKRHAALYRLLLADLLRFCLPPRRSRIAPRARKRPWSKHGLRRRGTAYRVVQVPPFPEVVAMLPPNPASFVAPPAA